MRQKREANNASLDQAGWIEHAAIGLMAEALGRQSRAPMADPSPPPPEPIPQDDAEPQPDPAVEADHYAIIYPRRAAQIRRHGGLPPDCDFGPPLPYVVRAVATGTSPILCALDAQAAATA